MWGVVVQGQNAYERKNPRKKAKETLTQNTSHDGGGEKKGGFFFFLTLRIPCQSV